MIGIAHLFDGVLMMVISLPLIKGEVDMNNGYGVRIKQTFASPEHWYLINHFGGKWLCIWGGLTLLTGVGLLASGLDFGDPAFLWIAFAPLAYVAVLAVQVVWFARRL